MGVEERVSELIEPVISGMSLDLVDVEFAGGVLRLTVDQPGGGITTDTLADVNHSVGPLLDLEDPVPGRYTLEVSSPGLSRKLRTPDHFRRAVGETVIFKLPPGGEVRRLKGTLTAADDTAATVEVTEIDGIDQKVSQARTVEFYDIESAATQFEWRKQKPKGKRDNAKSAPRSNS